MAEAVATPIPQTPVAEEPVSEVGKLSQRTLMRLRFTRNRLAMVGMIGDDHHVLSWCSWAPLLRPMNIPSRTRITSLAVPANSP